MFLSMYLLPCLTLHLSLPPLRTFRGDRGARWAGISPAAGRSIATLSFLSAGAVLGGDFHSPQRKGDPVIEILGWAWIGVL